MNTIKSIRKRLGITQEVLAIGMGCTQGNVGHYERGQTVPPEAAKRLISYASGLGHEVTFNDIYAPELAQATATSAPAAIEAVATDATPQTPAAALRTGTVRRHECRRLKDLPIDADRRHSGAPFQSPEAGVA